jgi:hypothetical protein
MIAPAASVPDSRVVVLGGSRSPGPADWREVADVAALVAGVGSPAALLLDFRVQPFTPTAVEARALAGSLARFPVVAILSEDGVSFGCARMECVLIEMHGSDAAAFADEAAAWAWLEERTGLCRTGCESLQQVRLRV